MNNSKVLPGLWRILDRLDPLGLLVNKDDPVLTSCLSLSDVCRGILNVDETISLEDTKGWDTRLELCEISNMVHVIAKFCWITFVFLFQFEKNSLKIVELLFREAKSWKGVKYIQLFVECHIFNKAL